MKTKSKLTALLFIAMAVSLGNTYLFVQDDMTETIKIMKANLADSKEKIKKYEWIETTSTFINGELKSKKQKQCYYGVDGNLTQVELGATATEKEKPGLRGKIAENRKEEMSDYVAAAAAKIRTYLPPDGEKLQQIYGAGKTAISILDPGKKFKIDFPEYKQPGDMLSISIDKEHKMIMGATVTTFIEGPSDKVLFDIKYKTLPDGTQYPGVTTLDAKAKNLKIVIENSGHKNAAGR